MEANAPIGRVSGETRQQLTPFILHRKIKSSLYLEACHIAVFGYTTPPPSLYATLMPNAWCCSCFVFQRHKVCLAILLPPLCCFGHLALCVRSCTGAAAAVATLCFAASSMFVQCAKFGHVSASPTLASVVSAAPHNYPTAAVVHKPLLCCSCRWIWIALAPV